jgi:amidase
MTHADEGLTVADIAELAARDSIELAPGEADELLPVIAALTDVTGLIERLGDRLQPVTREPRDPGWVPEPGENPYNSFIRRCEVATGASGPLSGLTVGIKDNIAVAGVPTTNGSRLSAYTPEQDAIVVERILSAGGTIVGKLNMDDWGGAGLGETSAFGPPRNPANPAHSAGGSSGGSGSAVRAGEVDLALAVDQGGSGRIPAAFCGVCAIKPTHGLVPSRGILHIDHTIDAVTPLAPSVDATALLLEVLAGEDPRDPQWVRGPVSGARYRDAAELGVEGMRIAIVEESCTDELCDPAVLAGLERMAALLTAAGAGVGRVSIPLWRDGLAIFIPYIGHLAADMFRTEGQGVSHLGSVDVAAMREYARSRRAESARLAMQMKCWVIADRFVHERHHGVPYGQLHNLRLALRADISAALANRDLLLTPTLPLTAPRLADASTPFAEVSVRTLARLPFNTSPINLSGHPAFSFPSGTDDDGLPTAVQIVARHFDELTAFRAAYALERATTHGA